MKIVLADDEKPARDRLRRLIAAVQSDGTTVLAEASNGLEALEAVQRHAPDVLFLDIEMPELDGLSVAATLASESLAARARTPFVVFVTAFDEHALKAFELSAADYLVKPVTEDRLRSTLARLAHRLASHQPSPQRQLRQTIERWTERPSLIKLAIRCGSRFLVFDPEKISAVLARDHYAGLVVEGKEWISDEGMESLERRLESSQFLRIHRGAIINLKYLSALEREGDRKYVAVLNDPAKTRVPVSRERLADLKIRLGLAES